MIIIMGAVVVLSVCRHIVRAGPVLTLWLLGLYLLAAAVSVGWQIGALQ